MRLIEGSFFLATFCLFLFLIADGALIALPLAFLASVVMKSAGVFRNEKQCRPLVLHSFTLPNPTQRVCDRSVGRADLGPLFEAGQ